MRIKNCTNDVEFEIITNTESYSLLPECEITMDNISGKIMIFHKEKSYIQTEELSKNKIFNYILSSTSLTLKCIVQLKVSVFTNQNISESLLEIRTREIMPNDIVVYRFPVIYIYDNEIKEVEYSVKDFTKLRLTYNLLCSFNNYNYFYYLGIISFFVGLIGGYFNENMFWWMLLGLFVAIPFGFSLTRKRRKLSKFKTKKKIKNILNGYK